jgi:UrcA family protein
MKITPVVDGFRPLIAAVLAGTLFSAVAAMPAFAGTEDSPPTVTVKFGDLDISQPQGAGALYVRIRNAARLACSPLERSGAFLGRSDRLNYCVQHSIADAVASVDSPTLFTVYDAKRGAAPMTRIASL